MQSEFLDQTREVRSGEELDAEKLAEYLHQQLPEVQGSLSIEQYPAGHSNLTYCIGIGDARFVLRRPPFGSKVKSAHDMGREYRVLSKLHKFYGPAPEPLVYCDDPDVIGSPFYLMQRIEGIILRKDLPPGMEIAPDLARAMSESFIDNLAALHALDYNEIGLAYLGKPHGYAQRQVAGWIKRYAGSRTDDIAEVGPVGKWLSENIPPEGTASLIHNDYKFDNVVLAGDDLTKIVGVLDWEMSTLGDSLMDLGTAISYWIDPDDPDDLQLIRWGPTTQPGCLNRRQLVEHYAQRTGRDTSNMVFYLAFAFFKTAVIAQQIYYRYHQGLTKDERFVFFIEATRILMRAALRTIETGKV